MKKLSRRTVLRGAAGGVLALPLLDIMMPSRSAAAEAAIPKRLVVWATPNGTVMDNWRPTSGNGERDFALSRILQPLASYKDDMIIVQNLSMAPSYGHHFNQLLTGRTTHDYGFPNLKASGISLDQYIANAWRGQTPIHSLQLAAGIDGGLETTTCMSWAGDGTPVPAESSPFAVYARLFGNGVPTQDAPVADRRIARRNSVIDSVKEQVSSLTQRLGNADKAVLDNYLESVRAIERELVELRDKQASCAAPTIGDDPTRPGQSPWWLENMHAPEVLRLQSRLTAAALACDLTRVVTLHAAPSGYRFYDFLDGVPGDVDLHGLSHDVEKGNREAYTRVEVWHMQQLALLLDDINAVVTPDGRSLLYHSLVWSTNEYGPNGTVDFLPISPVLGERAYLSHESVYMPFVFLGQAGGELMTGRNLECAMADNSEFGRAHGRGQGHNRLLVSLLNTFGFSDTTFGDPSFSQGALDGFYV